MLPKYIETTIIDIVYRYHNSKRLLPDYTSGMDTKVETMIHVQSEMPSNSGEDASVIVDMGKIKKDTKASKSIINTKRVHEERTAIYYEASLILDNVKPNQSGNYTCGPSNSLSASVRLHITQGNGQ